jgi:hypothetical protein
MLFTGFVTPPAHLQVQKSHHQVDEIMENIKVNLRQTHLSTMKSRPTTSGQQLAPYLLLLLLLLLHTILPHNKHLYFPNPTSVCDS